MTKKKSNEKERPCILLKNETKETVYRYDVEAEDGLYSFLVAEGLKRIQTDKEALFNYAVNLILRETLEAEKKAKKGKK